MFSLSKPGDGGNGCTVLIIIGDRRASVAVGVRHRDCIHSVGAGDCYFCFSRIAALTARCRRSDRDVAIYPSVTNLKYQEGVTSQHIIGDTYRMHSGG